MQRVITKKLSRKFPKNSKLVTLLKEEARGRIDKLRVKMWGILRKSLKLSRAQNGLNNVAAV